MKLTNKLTENVLKALNLTRSSNITFSRFKKLLKEKQLDYTMFHREKVITSRPLEIDEIQDLYNFIFNTSVIPKINEKKKKIEVSELEEYEIELLKVQYSEYQRNYIDNYINNIIATAAHLYEEAQQGALIQARELKVMKRSKKTGRTHWKTVKAQSFDEKGRFYGKLVVKHSAEYPSQKTLKTVFGLLEQASAMFVSFPSDPFKKLEHIVFNILPVFSPYCTEEQHDIKGIKFLAPLYKELLRVKFRVSKNGTRYFSLEGLKPFKHFVNDDFNDKGNKILSNSFKMDNVNCNGKRGIERFKCPEPKTSIKAKLTTNTNIISKDSFHVFIVNPINFKVELWADFVKSSELEDTKNESLLTFPDFLCICEDAKKYPDPSSALASIVVKAKRILKNKQNS